jgi:hypothetical protein
VPNGDSAKPTDEWVDDFEKLVDAALKVDPKGLSGKNKKQKQDKPKR